MINLPKMHSAIDMHDIQMIHALVNENENHLNITDLFGHTPLIYSIKSGNVDCIIVLIEEYSKLINFNAKCVLGHTALHHLVIHGDWKVLDLLLSTLSKKHTHIDLNMLDVDGNTPLHIACQINSIDHLMCALILIDEGADINIRYRHFNKTCAEILDKQNNKFEQNQTYYDYLDFKTRFSKDNAHLVTRYDVMYKSIMEHLRQKIQINKK